MLHWLPHSILTCTSQAPVTLLVQIFFKTYTSFHCLDYAYTSLLLLSWSSSRPSDVAVHTWVFNSSHSPLTIIQYKNETEWVM